MSGSEHAPRPRARDQGPVTDTLRLDASRAGRCVSQDIGSDRAEQASVRSGRDSGHSARIGFTSPERTKRARYVRAPPRCGIPPCRTFPAAQSAGAGSRGPISMTVWPETRHRGAGEQACWSGSVSGHHGWSGADPDSGPHPAIRQRPAQRQPNIEPEDPGGPAAPDARALQKIHLIDAGIVVHAVQCLGDRQSFAAVEAAI